MKGHLECHNLHSSAFESPAFSQPLGMESQTSEQKGPRAPYLDLFQRPWPAPFAGTGQQTTSWGSIWGLSLAKNGFYSFKWLRNIKEEKNFMMWKFHEIQISVSINKVLLEYSHSHSFMYCLQLLLCCGALAAESVQLTKPKLFSTWFFIEKNCLSLIWKDKTKQLSFIK